MTHSGVLFRRITGVRTGGPTRPRAAWRGTPCRTVNIAERYLFVYGPVSVAYRGGTAPARCERPMNEPHTEDVFGGIDSRVSDPTVPGWYRNHCDERRGSSVEFPSFRATVGDLRDRFGAETTEAYYYDENEGEYVEIGHRAAVVNPAGEGLGDSGAWTTASDSYEPVDAMDAYGPLVAVARDRGYEDVFGCATTYRNGGETVVEILFNDLRVSDPEGETEFVIGFETGFDHFRRSSVWASLMAYDAETGAALRGLSEKYSSPHRGDITERLAEWFDGMLDRAENLGDAIYEQVAEAREYEVPMYDVPVSVAEFYEALGFPASWGSEAADRLRDTRTPTAFSLYLVMAETVTREFDGKRNGDALRDHATRVNELLYAPDAAERKALVGARNSLTGVESGQATLDPEFETAAEAAVASLNERIDTLGEGVEAFESMRDRIRTMIETMDETETDEEPTENGESGDENGQELVTDGGVYETRTTEISVVEGVEVDLTIRAPDGDNRRADKVLMDVKERLGVLSAAFDHETPPSDLPDDLGELGDRYTPPMSVAWGRVFGDENGVSES